MAETLKGNQDSRLPTFQPSRSEKTDRSSNKSLFGQSNKATQLLIIKPISRTTAAFLSSESETEFFTLLKLGGKRVYTDR